MGAPRVVDGRLVFAVDDRDHRLKMVRLAVDDALVDDHRFRRTARGWTLSMAVPPVSRLEYRFLVIDGDGDTHVLLDPDNPESVATAFGRRSVAKLPDYVEPDWRTGGPADATRGHLVVPTTVGDVPVVSWQPPGLDADTAVPLLVVHDGPEYDVLAELGHWASAVIATGRTAPFRMALLQPVRRDDWYAVNPDWPAAVGTIVTHLDTTFARHGSIVTMGASLGGLAALQVARADVVATAGAFSQSGSFFQPDLDPQEADYPHFARISTWVRGVGAGDPATPPLDIAMTCGRHEENHANNVAMADRLAVEGHAVSLQALDDLHNYTAWRDGLDPGLVDLLGRTWGPPP